MVFTEDFEIPGVDESVKPVPITKANDDAFYAAGAYSQDPINDYQTMYQEQTQQGYSSTLESAKRTWEQEQNTTNKEAVLSIINDPEIPREDKVNVLSTYAASGYISQNLRDKYVQRIGAIDMGITHTQADAQDAVAINIPNTVAKVENRQARSGAMRFVDAIVDSIDFVAPGQTIRKPDGAIDWAKSLSPTQLAKDVGGEVLGAANFISSIPNFFAAKGYEFGEITYDLLNKQKVDWEGAIQRGDANAAKGINSLFDWRLNGLAKKVGAEKEFEHSVANNLLNTVGEGIQWLDQKGVEKGITKPGQIAVAADALMVFGGPIVKGYKAVKRGVEKKLDAALDVPEFAVDAPNYRPNSPIENTIAANPKIAADLAKEAITEPTERSAEILGTNKGTLVYKLVMPKAIEQHPDVIANPDLHKEIIKINEDLNLTLTDTTFDPNVVDRVGRLADLNAIEVIANDTRGATYMQSNSRVSPTIDQLDAHLVFGRDSNYFFNSRRAVVQAYSNLKEYISTLPEGERGQLYITDRVTNTKLTPEQLVNDPRFNEVAPINDKQFSLDWEFSKKYDVLDYVMSGPKAKPVKFTYVGTLDATKFLDKPNPFGSKWTSIGPYITPHGRFSPWMERGLARAFDRSTYISHQTYNIIKKNFADRRLNNELNTVIYDAQAEHVDLYSKLELQDKFGYLTSKEIDLLFQKQVAWRQVNDFHLLLTDRSRRNEMVQKGFDRGLFKDDKYMGIGAATKFELGGKVPTEVWDFDSQTGIPFELDRSLEVSMREGTYDTKGRQLVRLSKNVEGPDGSVYEYALLGTSVKHDVLPSRVVKGIPGYSPIIYTEHFFIDAIPKKLRINGVEVTDPLTLSNYKKTIAAAKTKYEAEVLQKEMQLRYPEHTVESRGAREDNYNDHASMYEVHGDVVRNAMRRGERLPSVNGPARVEDPMTALLKTTRATARIDAFKDFKRVFEEYFVKEYREFLPDENFPTNIEKLDNKYGRLGEEKFRRAVAEYEYISSATNFADGADISSMTLHSLADVLEKYKVPGNVLREQKYGLEYAAHPITTAKKAGSLFYIAYSPIRQWITQPINIVSYMTAMPKFGTKSLALSLAVRTALLEEASMLKRFKGVLSGGAKKAVKGLISPADFDIMVKGIKESGLLESVDQNLMVNELLTDTTRPLVETTAEKLWARATTPFTSASKIVKKVGFDAAELTNRLFMWSFAREKWIDQNPGKNWRTPEALEEISHEGWKLSGSMSRAGALPYQKGLLSPFFQFTAISQKQLLLALQDGGSLLTKRDQTKLFGAQAVLFGTAGVLGAKYLVDWLLTSDDPEVLKIAKELRKGAVDRIGNVLFKAIAGDEIDPDLNFSKSLNPFGESNLGIPYIDVIVEGIKFMNGQPGTKVAALEAMGRIQDTMNTIHSYFTTKDVTDKDFSRVLLEGAQFASGMSAWAKSQYMFAYHDKITKDGKPMGLESTNAEALAQIFGITTYKEEDFWRAGTARREYNAEVQDMAKDIHQQITKTIVNDPKLRDDPDIELKRIEMLRSFLSVLKDTKNWPDQKLLEVKDQVLDLDRQANKDLKSSLIEYVFKKKSNEYDKNLQIIENATKDEKNKDMFDAFNFIKGKGNP